MIYKEKPVMLASSSEKADLDRLMLIWANRFPGIPENVDLIKYEYFAAKTVGMALSSVQGAVITKKYIKRSICLRSITRFPLRGQAMISA